LVSLSREVNQPAMDRHRIYACRSILGEVNKSHLVGRNESLWTQLRLQCRAIVLNCFCGPGIND
jgi:hypothetical protein